MTMPRSAVPRNVWNLALVAAIVSSMAFLVGSMVETSSAQSMTSSLYGPPVPAESLPNPENTTPSVGSSTDYMRADAVLPRITRAATVTTDATGNWSVTWATPLLATPTVLPIAINAGSQPVSCNVITRSTTAATGRCWTAQSSLLNLGIVTAGLSILPYANSAAGVQVQVIALPPTQ